MGVQFEWYGDRTRRWFPNSWLRHADRVLLFPAEFHRIHGGRNSIQSNAFFFGHTAFTPLKGEKGVNLAITEPIFDDRPYASLVFVKARHTSAAPRRAFVSDLTLGILGLKIGEAGQTFIHKHISNDVRPGGWTHQIADGGEVTAKYRASMRWLVVGDTTPHHFDFSITADGSAGYYTNGSVGGRARLGWIASPFWASERMPIDPYVVTLSAIAERAGEPEEFARAAASWPARAWRRIRQFWSDAWNPSEGYLWISGGETAWYYNALLEGQFRHSDVTLSHDRGPARLERFVGDAELGLTVRWKTFSATYSLSAHQPLFDGPRRRTHWWGGFYLIFAKDAR